MGVTQIDAKRRPDTGLDSQALAAFGATGVDDSATAAGFHANQKAVGTGTAGLGRLVCAFHFEIFLTLHRIPTVPGSVRHTGHTSVYFIHSP